MSQDKTTKQNGTTAAGYNLEALQREGRVLRQERSQSSNNHWLPNPANQGTQWKGSEASPLARILEKRPAFRVLIVDDSKPIRQLIRSLLNSFEVQNVGEASDGKDAIRSLQDSVPDLIITDLEMAPMNGIEFARQVRNNPRSPNPDMPIVIMTGHTERQRILEIHKSGLTEIMAKPVTPNFLSRNILVAMDRYDRKKASQLAAEADDETEDSDDFFNI